MRALLVLAVLTARARADDWQDARRGLVFEASVGGGGIYHGPWGPLLSVLEPSDKVQAFAAFAAAGAVGVGGWLGPRVALTARIEGNAFRDDRLTSFVGPDLQYWLPPLSGPLTGEPTLWLGGGLGAAFARPFAAGLGIDARAGIAIGALQLSIEGTEGIFHGAEGNTVTLSAALLVGYQFL